MDQTTLEKLLTDLPLGAVRYYPMVTSTNDLAARWAGSGAPDLSLIVADEQTAGRGRLDRRWFTPPGTALAFTLIVKNEDQTGGQTGALHLPYSARYTALGALAVCDTLNAALPAMLPSQIKWPNDVVAQRRKLAGILAEAQWHGSQLTAVILGVGINVAPESVPAPGEVNFPATCVEDALEKPVDRWELLRAILQRLLYWRKRLDAPEFIQAWGTNLAFRGEWVYIAFPDKDPMEGQVLGLSPDGSLRVRNRQGEVLNLQMGEIHLRPVEAR
jgi:BirA family biotin operon repressor/biotin-[acetyl-CoA-carboxylase] ligase